MKRLKNTGPSSTAPIVDGIHGDSNIANLFASKFRTLLKFNRNSSVSDHRSQNVMSDCNLVDILFTEDSTAEALLNLKPNKVDASGISSEHLKFASPVIAKQFALLFTSIIRHGYMPQCLRDSVIVPIPKGNKDASCI